MSRIAVVGGAGYIGSHTVAALVDAGYTPVIIDNFCNSDRSVIDNLKKLTGKDIKYFDLDFTNQAALQDIFVIEKIDAVIHFAAHKAVGVSVADPLKYYDNNVSGFVSLLKSCDAAGIKSIIFSSSAAVYGEPKDASVDETTPCEPTNPYGWSKRMDEIILDDYCKANPDVKGIALRYFNVVGSHASCIIGESPNGKPNNLLPIIVKSLQEKTQVTLHGDDYSTPDGTCMRDYIHVVDLADAHVKALHYGLTKNSGLYDVFNVGTGKPTSVLELIQTFEKVNSVKVDFRIGPRRPGDPTAYYANPSKIQQMLGWKSNKTIEDAVKSAWDWQQSQR